MNIAIKAKLVTLCAVLAITSPQMTIAVSENASVDVLISTNITVSTTNGMVFGDLTSGPSGGVVVLTTDGVRVSTGSVALNAASVSSPAIFYISGIPNAAFTVVLPTSITLSDGGNNQIIVTNFRSDPDASGQLSGSGVKVVSVGGTLNIGANQGFGIYSGYFSVVIAY